MREKLRNAWLTVRDYWDRPRREEYVAYKEIAMYSIGGIGVKTVNSMLSYISLSAQCMLVAQVYGLSPINIMILFIITNVINVIKTPFVSKLVDNTHTKIGKFRPYLIWAGIPSVIGVCALSWMPLFESMLARVIWIGIMFNLLNIAQPLYNNAYMGISQVITPNSGERTKIMSLSEFVANLGPSLVQLLLPSIAGIVLQDKDSMTNLLTYRIFLPIFALVGFLLGLVVMYNTQERVLDVEKDRQKIKFTYGMKMLARNRNFWIVTISKFFDGFKAVISTLLMWVVVYQMQQSSIYGIIQTITSVAFTPGMLLAPLMMSKLGSRKAGFLAHIFNALAALIMLLVFKNGVVLFVIALFIWNFASGPQYVMQTSILSDGLDWQQDKEGVRLEGFAQNFMTMITTLGTILSTVVFTLIYEHFGLKEGPDGKMDYTVLSTDAEMRNNIIFWVIIVVIITSALAALPYLWCNLSRKDMSEIRKRLEERKYILENNLSELPEEEKAAAYALHLKEEEERREKENEELRLRKEQAQRDYEEAERKKAEYKEAMAQKRQELIDQGMSPRTADKQIKAMIRADREEKARLQEQERSMARARRQAFRQRRKEFIKQDVAARKAAGEKRYLRILAREKFNAIIVEENNADNGIQSRQDG